MLYRTFCNINIRLYFDLFYWSLGTPQFYEIGKIVQSFKMYVDVKYICKNIKTIVH